MKVLVLLLLIVCGTTVYDNSLLTKCIGRTIQKVFTKNESIIYIFDGNNSEFSIIDDNPRILFDIRTKIKVPSTYRKRKYCHNYVVQASEFKNLVDGIRALLDNSLSNHKLIRTGTYLIVTLEENLEKKIKYFWNLGIINVIFLVYNLNGAMNVFTSDPQNPNNNCGLILKEFLRFDDCFASRSIQLPKFFRKYSNCNLTYAYWTSKGRLKLRLFKFIEFILYFVVEQLNVSLILLHKIPEDYSDDLFYIYPQLRQIIVHEAHTSTIVTDSMIWVVPFPQKLPNMKTMKMMFKSIVWYFVFVVFLSASFTWWLITKVLHYNSSITESILRVYSITLFGSVDKLYLFRSMRCLFLAYVLYSIHIQTAFISKLIEVLTIPQYEPAIKTLTELSECDTKIVTNSLYYENYFEHDEHNSTLYNAIKKKLEVLTNRDFSEVLIDYKSFRNKAVLVSSNEFDLLNTFFRTKFHIIEENTLISKLERVFAGHPDSYILETIDILLKRLVESGILDHFLKNFKYNGLGNNDPVFGEPTVLTVQHLHVVFVFWGAVTLVIVCSTTISGDSTFNKCIARTVERVFTEDKCIIYIFDDNAEFPTSDDNPKILFDIRTKIDVPSTYRCYCQNYVVVAHDIKNLVNAIRAILLSRLSDNNLIRTVYNKNGTMNVFTSDPQAPSNNCGVTLKEYIRFDDCFGSTPIQLPKLLRKYTNCNVTHVSWVAKIPPKVKLYALIKYILGIVVEQLNVSLIMLYTIDESYIPDLFSIYLQVRQSILDQVHTSIFVTDCMVWVVPFPQKLPDMKSLKMVFTSIVWYFSLLVFLGASLVWWLITKVLNRNSSITKPFLDVFSITLFGSVNKLYLFRSMRCLFIAYVLYSIHIQTAFTSKLIEVLTIPQYEPAIKSLTELSESDRKIVTNELYYDNFFEHDEHNSTLYSAIKKKFEILSADDFADVLVDYESLRNKAVLVSSNELDVLNKVFLTDFHTIKENILIPKLERVLAGRPSCYVLKTIDVLIVRLVESGILDHFLKKFNYENLANKSPAFGEPAVLTVQHLYAVFVFWSLGLILSALIMIFELIYVCVVKSYTNY
ncbi:hypothetical protein FQR65_LT13441 [Abscondita terminalis]|nr:hypothetical protein FQR65_LT13441 [Abscondita terminalis]